MTKDEFRDHVEDFGHFYCSDYTREVLIEYDWSDEAYPRATVRLGLGSGKTRKLDIVVEDDDTVIDLGDHGTLSCDSLYLYLWSEAEFELSELQRKYDKLMECKGDM